MNPQMATDSTLFYPAAFLPGQAVCHFDNAPATSTTTTQHIDNYAMGIAPTQRPLPPSQDSGILAIIIATLLLFTFNITRSRRLIKTFTQNLWSTRRRENAFDEHTTSEARSMITLIIGACVFQALLLFTIITSHLQTTLAHPTITLCSLTALTLLYYLFQSAAYQLIGTTFSDKIGASQWVKGFNAAHSLSGLLIMIPSLATLFYPSSSPIMLFIGIALYFTARVIFICKGFRIFYHNFGSLLYFILYLCTLEIIPVIWIYSGALLLVDFLM